MGNGVLKQVAACLLSLHPTVLAIEDYGLPDLGVRIH